MKAKRKGRMTMGVIAITPIILVVAIAALFFTAKDAENMPASDAMKVLPLMQRVFADLRLPPRKTTSSAAKDAKRDAIVGATPTTVGVQPESASRDLFPVEHRLLRKALDDLEGQMTTRSPRGDSAEVAANAAGDVSQPTLEKGGSQ